MTTAEGGLLWQQVLADVEEDVAPTAMTRLHGRAPAELKGTLFRNGPAKFRRPGLALEMSESEKKFGENWLYGRPLPPLGE